MVWVYARTFFSEPLLTFFFLLTCYGIRAFHDTRAARWMVVAGLAAGLAVLTKLQGVLVLPAAAIYFVALEVRAEEKPVFLEKTGFWRGIRGMLVPGLLFVGALAVGLVATGYFNFARFGDVLQSGRGEVSQAFPILQGLYGLLLSSGKSVFLYAPPIILSFFAFPRFFKRHLAEALLCVTFILTFIVFHARLQIWSGDGAWGPRYLVSTLPFWVLPIGAILKDWWRNLLTRGVVIALVLAGIFVNLLGLTINFDAYINLQPNGNARHFTLAASPILAHWDLLRARVADWWGEVVAAQNSVVLVKGFLAGGEELFPRYLASRALILIKSDLNQPLELNLEALDYRPEQKEKRRLVFRANGAELPSALMPRLESGRLQYSVRIPADARWLPVEIDTLGSEPVGTSPMGDELGVHLQSLEIDALPILKDISIPPLPTAIPKAAWAWFYEPAHAQFDFVAWYLFFSGLDDAAVVAIIVVFSLAGILGLIGSAPTIWRAVR
jgi:4-amino-4-deoxy-L-arabinose transferase-like glycosyltransferase